MLGLLTSAVSAILHFEIFGVSLASLYAGACVVLVTLLVLSYFVPHLAMGLLARKQDLKKKYGAEWALVTGSSSGIGKAIAENLAQQGISVVLVALADKMLDDAHADLTKRYPEVRFVKCGCDLSRPGYMDTIKRVTATLPVSIVANNAGYLLMGFFRQRSAADHLANLECNSVSAVNISHHFYVRMINENRKGCITFTSSAAWYFPAPFVVMYGASKAMMSTFAVNLGIEAKDHGIDVFCVHPSYTRTNLYAKTDKLGILNFFEKFALTPDDVAKVVLRGVGRGTSAWF